MIKYKSILFLLIFLSFLLFISIKFPEILNDEENESLKRFVNEQLLSFLGIIITITLT